MRVPTKFFIMYTIQNYNYRIYRIDSMYYIKCGYRKEKYDFRKINTTCKILLQRLQFKFCYDSAVTRCASRDIHAHAKHVYIRDFILQIFLGGGRVKSHSFKNMTCLSALHIILVP